MIHGTVNSYAKWKCRCDKCKAAMSAHNREHFGGGWDRDDIADLLHELAPDGLTDDCPARRAA